MSRLCYEGRCDHCSDVDSDAEIENEIDNLIELGTDSEPEVPQVSPDPDELQAARLILELGQTVQSSGRCSRPPDLQEQGDLGDGKKAAQTSAPQVSSNPQQFPVARQILESWRNALSSERYSPPSSLQKLDDLRDGKQAVQFSAPQVSQNLEVLAAASSSLESGGTAQSSGHCNPPPDVQELDSLRDGRQMVQTSSLPERKIQIWVVGHSFVCDASKQSKAHERSSFPRPVEIHWMGDKDLCWPGFLPFMTSAIEKQGPPDILVVHLGDGDLGKGKSLDLLISIREDFKLLHSKWPTVKLCWSDFIPRVSWERGVISVPVITRVMKKLNRAIYNIVSALGGMAIKHPLITVDKAHLYTLDGDHLTDEGLWLFIEQIYWKLGGLVRTIGGEQCVR
ncbi:uncharacterized protein LOC142140804 isoform X1 [Mixophyes fleayi]|uniref:uncharacterized protein LOC142140804 isoform X1 n=1 Tax=Mixophyes fleayi TaxID=3061075 RepID=UPI003F4DEBB8